MKLFAINTGGKYLIAAKMKLAPSLQYCQDFDSTYGTKYKAGRHSYQFHFLTLYIQISYPAYRQAGVFFVIQINAQQ